jgi:hypothetical protein
MGDGASIRKKLTDNTILSEGFFKLLDRFRTVPFQAHEEGFPILGKEIQSLHVKRRQSLSFSWPVGDLQEIIQRIFAAVGHQIQFQETGFVLVPFGPSVDRNGLFEQAAGLGGRQTTTSFKACRSETAIDGRTAHRQQQAFGFRFQSHSDMRLSPGWCLSTF